MVGDDYAPGRLERLFRSIPDGAVLRGIFFALLVLAIGTAALDYQALAAADAERERLERTEPMPLAPPSPGDQVRPFLPRTIPVGPDRGEPRLPGYDGPVPGEAMARPMTFRTAPGALATAVGRIDPGTADALRAFLDGVGAGARTLVLHSPGGAVEDAMAMARLLRERRLDTEVPADGYCASACPLVLAGGVHRSAGAGAWIGLHQVYAAEGAAGFRRLADLDRSISDIQSTVARCQELLAEMGIAPEVWIKAMRTPPEALYVLTPQELAEANFTTKPVQGPPMPDSLARAFGLSP
ncbi:hypothetical protein GCM10011390_09140 [Aureimonas endophytica]|uniref:ClpP protease-like protein n=1 Tax=Aureimonas endophytica TaxID=2027858 RepID=A0A916ZFR5_9HYPH|nr:ATP-dependent Clp protease proteolytic subunit [Aureimonas endophytica]GGD92584.1 hypothetical protein GCM10011390_09140 [Aureimonas endophytica]